MLYLGLVRAKGFGLGRSKVFFVVFVLGFRVWPKMLLFTLEVCVLSLGLK